MTIKTSNIYAYFVPSLNAIKVGYGDSSVQRMKSYVKQYGLDVAESSLRSWEIPVSGVAQTIESECHKTLLASGLERLSVFADEQEAQELFGLGDITYEALDYSTRFIVFLDMCRRSEGGANTEAL